MTGPVNSLGMTYADLDELRLRFDHARPGDKIFYARGEGVLNPENPTVQQVNRWASQGKVTLHNKIGLGRLMMMCGQRQAIAPIVSAGELAAKALALAGTPAGDLLDYIRGLIADGLPMPLNAAIADELAWRDKHQVRYRLNQLQLCGLVTVTFGKADERIVTCTVTGHATARVDMEQGRARA